MELLCFVRNDKNYFNTPFLMISDEMSKEKVFYAFEEGVDAYITKPFTEKNVINAVNEILMKKSSPDPLHYKIQRLNSLKLQEKYDDAIELGENLLKKNNRPDILFLLSNCYQKIFKTQKAIESLQKVLEMEQNSKAYHLLGKIYMEEEEEYDKAIEYFEKAYSLNPMNRNIVIDIGNHCRRNTPLDTSLVRDPLTDLSG